MDDVKRAESFEGDVMPCVLAWADRARLDDDGRADALGWAWQHWLNRPGQYGGWVYARMAVRDARNNKGLPGERRRRKTDRYHHGRFERAGRDLSCLLADRAADPADVAEWRDELRAVRGKLGTTARRCIDVWAEDWGVGTHHMAALLGISPGRVSQIRREVLQAVGE